MKKRSLFSRQMICFIAATISLNVFLAGTLCAEEVPSSKESLDDLFQTAMADRDAGRYYEAIKGFSTILSNQPTLNRARLELAVAYYQTYKFQEALSEAKQVLDDPNTPPPVKVAILAFIAQVEKGQSSGLKTSQFRFPISVGVVFDSNTGRISDEIDAQSSSSTTKESDTAKILSVGINHNYIARHNQSNPESLSVFIQSGVNIYHRGYFDVENEDLNVLSFWTGPTVMSGNDWRFNLNLQEDIIEYADEKYGYYHTLTPTFSTALPLNLELTLDAAYSSRDLKQVVYEGHDSDYVSAGGALGYTCYEGKIASQIGAQYFHEDADSAKYTNDGSKYFIGLSYLPTKPFSVTAKFDQANYNFDQADLASDPSARDERETNYTFAISYTFENIQVLDKWTVEAKIVDTEYDSNISRYDYDRTQTYVTLSRTF